MKTKLLSFDFITQGHIINQSIDHRGNNNPPTKKMGGAGSTGPEYVKMFKIFFILPKKSF